MQAKLPDVNAAIVRHRSLAVDGFIKENAELAITSIANINALLPAIVDGKSYKVQVSTERYNELRSETREIQCNYCKKENSIKTVKQYNLELDWLEKIVAKRRSQKMWICTECKRANVFSTDNITVKKKGEPYFFQVIPEPPKRQSGIRGRMSFDRDFIRWYSIAMPEIESQIGLYRMEYAQQDGSELKEFGDEIVENIS